MTEIPPSEGSPNVPPVQAYAAYPRGGVNSRYGSPEKLQALMEGYYGLNWAFLALIGLGLVAVAVAFAGQGSSAGVSLFIIVVILAVVAVGVVSYPSNKKIGFGMGWSESTPAWISVGLAIGSCVISPVIVFLVVQLIAMGEIKNYGVKSGFFGVRKKDIQARIEQLRAQASSNMAAPPHS